MLDIGGEQFNPHQKGEGSTGKRVVPSSASSGGGGQPLNSPSPTSSPPVPSGASSTQTAPSPVLPTAVTRVQIPGANNASFVLAIVTLSIAAVFYLVFMGLSSGIEKNISEANRSIQEKQKEVNSEENQKLQAEYNAMRPRIELYKKIISNRPHPLRLTQILLLRYPKKGLFKSLTFEPSGKISISGDVFTLTEVAKAYVALRDFALVKLSWKGTGMPDINEAVSAFSADKKSDAFGFLISEKEGAVVFTQEKLSEYRPLENHYIANNLRNWQIETVIPAFSDIKISSLSLPKKDTQNPQPLESLLINYSFGMNADRFFFLPPFKKQVILPSGGSQK